MRRWHSYDLMAYSWNGSRADYVPGADYELSSDYCTTQLPLIRPSHPDAVLADVAAGYDHMGTYSRPRYSLVTFVPYKSLFDSDVFLRVIHELSLSAAGDKIAWDNLEQRKFRLHATIASGLDGDMPEHELSDLVRSKLSGHPMTRAQAFGPWFFGSKNGRLYLPLRPETTSSGYDALSEIQVALGKEHYPGFYVGLLNLADHLVWNDQLEIHEADAMFDVLRRYDRSVVAEFDITELALLRTHDDLILNSRVVERFDLEPVND